MAERGLKLWWAGASPKEIQGQLPAFVDICIEKLGYEGEHGIKNMIDKRARPMFESFVSIAQRDAGQGAFRLPRMVDLEPAVWEHLERLIKSNEKISVTEKDI